MMAAFKAPGCARCGKRVEGWDDLEHFHIAHLDASQKNPDITQLKGSVALWARQPWVSCADLFNELLLCRPLCGPCNKTEGHYVPTERELEQANGQLSLAAVEWITQTTWNINLHGGEQTSWTE